MRSGVLYCGGCALTVDLDADGWQWRLLALAAHAPAWPTPCTREAP